MGSRTSIEWTDATWNPIRGCSRVSEGCRNCYAEAIATRFSRAGQAYHEVADRRGWTRSLRFHQPALDLPLRWRRPRRVFVNSMSDLFHENIPDKWIDELFAVMALASQHTFLVLTKRPARMRAYCTLAGRRALVQVATGYLGSAIWDGTWWPLANVHLGVSVEDQATADERMPLLLETPAAIRWVSYEPALGPVDFANLRGGTYDALDGLDRECIGDIRDAGKLGVGQPERGLDWIVVGGESGPGARPFDVTWARSTLAQCKAADVPCFMKQMGRWVLGDHEGFKVNHWLLRDGHGFVPPIIGPNAYQRPADAIGFSLFDRKGGDMKEWPEDIRVREYPLATSTAFPPRSAARAR